MSKVKLVHCLHRKKGMSVEEFHDYWQNKHGPLVREVSSALGVKRYVQSHSLHNELVEDAFRLRGYTAKPFDGIAELTWDSIEEFGLAGISEKGQAAGARLNEDEKNFIDPETSPAFVVTEKEVIPVK